MPDKFESASWRQPPEVQQIWKDFDTLISDQRLLYDQAVDKARKARDTATEVAVGQYHKAIREADATYNVSQTQAWKDYWTATASQREHRDARLDGYRRSIGAEPEGPQ